MLWSLEALTAFPLAVNMSALYNTNVNITTPLIRAVGQTVSLSVEEPEPLAMLRRSSFVKPDLCFWGLFYPVATYKCCFWSGAFLLTAEREIHRRDCPSTDSVCLSCKANLPQQSQLSAGLACVRECIASVLFKHKKCRFPERLNYNSTGSCRRLSK